MFAGEAARGIKVPDVVWISKERFDRMPADAEASPRLPEIVVEVLSEGKPDEEVVVEKRQLYLDEGAEEMWACSRDGAMTFYDETGEHDASPLSPSFPKRIDRRVGQRG